MVCGWSHCLIALDCIKWKIVTRIFFISNWLVILAFKAWFMGWLWKKFHGDYDAGMGRSLIVLRSVIGVFGSMNIWLMWAFSSLLLRRGITDASVDVIHCSGWSLMWLIRVELKSKNSTTLEVARCQHFSRLKQVI